MKQSLRNKPRLAERRASAAVRQAAAALLTPQQKLAKLDQAFGSGVGAAKERARLAFQIANPKKAPAQTAKLAVDQIAASKKRRPRAGTAKP